MFDEKVVNEDESAGGEVAGGLGEDGRRFGFAGGVNDIGEDDQIVAAGAPGRFQDILRPQGDAPGDGFRTPGIDLGHEGYHLPDVH